MMMNMSTATAVPRAAQRALAAASTNCSKFPSSTVVAAAVRCFSTGTRGARGHGWYVNYRAGKGGRHLQGRYHDRESLESCERWNDAILQLGSTQVFMDIVLEPKTQEAQALAAAATQPKGTAKKKKRRNNAIPSDVPSLDELTESERHRLVMNVAEAVMPETVDNFLKILQLEQYGYKGTKLYRFEKDVGICGGDVLTNKGKTGLAAPYEYTDDERSHPLMETAEPLRRTLFQDPLAMWHIPGTVTMFVDRVHEVDSRFLLCTQRAMHMDGIHRAFGQLQPESLETLRNWEASLLTKDAGIPSSYDLIVVDCGVMDGNDGSSRGGDGGGKDDKEEASVAA